jgi:Spy/CpxP family protein refolding chaperone
MTRTVSRIAITSLLLLFSAFLATPALRAQDEPPPEGEGRKRVEDFRRMKLIETLDLKEEQAIRYFTREKDFRESEHGLQQQRQQIIEKLRGLVKDGSDADVQKEMQSLVQVGKDMVQKRVDYFNGLKDILSTKQMAKLLIFEDTFAKELRSVLQSPKMRERFRQH